MGSRTGSSIFAGTASVYKHSHMVRDCRKLSMAFFLRDSLSSEFQQISWAIFPPVLYFQEAAFMEGVLDISCGLDARKEAIAARAAGRREDCEKSKKIR
jgi:hypothetical protein